MPSSNWECIRVPIPPEAIIDLAQKSGFDSELRVAAIARRAKMHVRQSVYYIDKDERKGRELDLHIYLQAMDKTEPVISCAVEMCVEVKKTRDPFIFFTSERDTVEPGQGFSLIRCLHNVDNNLIGYNDIERLRPLGQPPRLARSYVGAKGSQQIQSGIISAVKAALHFRDQCEDHWDEKSRDIHFFVPILVVDGPLCECYLDVDAGELRASEVSDVVYAQNYLSDSYGDVSNQVYVMTLQRFDEIVGSFSEWAISIRDALVKTRHKQPDRNLHETTVPPEGGSA